jgi:uncharacterized protein (TIGR03437 family)
MLSTERGIERALSVFLLFWPLFFFPFSSATAQNDPGHEESSRQQDRYDWFRRIRQGRGGRVDAKVRLRALSTMEKRIGDPNPAASSATSTQWTLIGPQPADFLSSGRVTSLAVDPNDTNTVYLGAAEGGVWKTTDGGLTWTPLTDQQASLAIGSLAIDPNDSNTIYAGTGEANFNVDAYYGAGVLKSTDAGKTWTMTPGPFVGLQIGAIAVSPANGQDVIAGAVFNIYVSNDGGQTWNGNGFVPGAVTSLVYDPTSANTAYAAVGTPFSGSSGVYQTTDGGQTWTPVNGTGTTALPLTNAGRIALAMDPSSPKTLYAGLQNASGATNPLLGVYKTTDGGLTWNQISSVGYCSKQCWYNNVVAVSPTNPSLLVGGGVTASFSTDGGATWTSLIPFGNVHVDQHAVAFSKDGSTVYLGNDGGVWVSSTSAISTTSWRQLNTTLAITQFYPGVSTNPTNATIAFGGSQDNNVLNYTGNLKWHSVNCGDGAATAIDPSNPQNVYVSCGGSTPGGQPHSVYRSSTGGTAGTYVPSDTGISATEGVPFVPYMTIDPSNPQNLYFTGNRHVYQTTNGAQNWTAISPDVTNGTDGLTALAVAPSDSNTVYSGSADGQFAATTNAGAGAESSWALLGTILPGGSVTHIEVDPKSRTRVYVTVGGAGSDHVFRSDNGGQTWTDISGNLPDVVVSSLVIDPDLPNTLYIGTDIGVFWTNDAGANWSPLVGNMPYSAVLSLGLHEASRTLRAATHGRSVWDLGVSTSGLNLIPEAASLAPSSAALGASGVTLTIAGADFVSGSTVRWNGSNRPTTFVNANQLKATLTASDLSTDGFAAISVSSPGPGGGISRDLYFKTGAKPAIFPTGFLNGASFAPLAVTGAAPGSIVSFFGADLAAANSIASSAPLPITLGGLSLSLGGVSVPEFFVSPGQVNVQIPWDWSNNFNLAEVLVAGSGSYQAAPIDLPISLFSPGIFTVTQTGSGQGTVTISSTGQLAAPLGAYGNSRPAERGEYITIYCTGLGAVDHQPLTGYPTPSSPLANTQTVPEVILAGMNLKPSFSGLAPGFVGLNQVNVQVPSNAPAGNAISLTLVMSDGFTNAVSNTVTLAIQ